jgi:hypothetical protein
MMALVELRGFARTFFSLFSRFAKGVDADWLKLRDVREYSHVARAVLARLSLISLTIAAH